MEYDVKGQIKIDNQWKPYRKRVDAFNESGAAEHFLTIVGSKHRLKRSNIRIETIQKAGE